MKNAKQLFWVWTLLGAFCATAQTNPVSTATEPIRDGSVVSPEVKTSDSSDPVAIATRPLLTERSKLPDGVNERLRTFQKQARAYVQKEQELKKQLQGANDQQRAAIRDQLQQLREQLLERSRELRKEFKEREKELAEKMTEYRELLDDVRSAAKDQLKTTRDETRTRRGED